MTTKRLEILKKSLEKKTSKFHDALNNHFSDVKQANGQPLNDKRNGQATLRKWEKQNDSLRTLDKEIENTKNAIEREESTIAYVERTKEMLPSAILEAMEAGKLNQWRKHPTIFFVAGVDKGRIQYDAKTKTLFHRFLKDVSKEQYPIFRDTVNALRKELLAREEIVK